jgi:hypothetical protein
MKNRPHFWDVCDGKNVHSSYAECFERGDYVKDDDNLDKMGRSVNMGN